MLPAPGANAGPLRAESSTRRTRRLSPCGLSPLGIRDTGQDAHQGETHVGRFITSPGDLPPSACHATDCLNQHRALASYCTNFNFIENRVSVAKRQSERPSERPNFGDCPRIPDGRDSALARRTRRLAHKGDFGDCPRIQAANHSRFGRFHRNIFSKTADCGDCPRIPLKKPVWASRRLARRVPLPRIEPHIDKAGNTRNKQCKSNQPPLHTKGE